MADVVVHVICVVSESETILSKQGIKTSMEIGRNGRPFPRRRSLQLATCNPNVDGKV